MVRRAPPHDLVFGSRGSVGGPTTATGISSLAARSLTAIIARRRHSASAGMVATTFSISSWSFGKDGLRNSVGFGLKLKTRILTDVKMHFKAKKRRIKK